MTNQESTNCLELKNEERKKLLLEIMNDPVKRKYACEKSVALFSLYYFSQYHWFDMPDFHEDMYKDLSFDDVIGAMWVMFRESAKTSLAKIGLAHAICYVRKNFILWVSYDLKKAASNLYDVALSLQTNDRILEDFGQLFYEPDMSDDIDKRKFSKKKSIAEFITVNKIKVKAYSTVS